MAEIAGGAVRSLLGVIRDEMYRLGRVEGDVLFIKEEMESMNSFLMHLARTTPPGREHDEQVRTWMKQVRELAHDCNNSIDRYLRQGDPAVYRARSSMGYLWWVPWYLRKLAAQHLAASELHELKSRARDVGERRLRYGVKVPAAKGGAGAGETETPPPPAAIRVGEMKTRVTSAGLQLHRRTDEEDIDSSPNGLATKAPIAFAEPRLRQQCTEELVSWLGQRSAKEDQIPAIAIVGTDKEDGDKVLSDVVNNVSMLDKFKNMQSIDVTGCDRALEILKQISGQLLLIDDGNLKKKKELDEKMEDIRGTIQRRLQAGKSPLDILLEVVREKLNQATDDQVEIEKTIKLCKEGEELPPQSKEGRAVATERPANKQQQHVKLSEDQIIEDKIKQTTEKVISKMLRQLLPKSQSDEDQRVEETMIKIQGVLENIRDQLLIKEQTIKIHEHLQGKVTLFVLRGATGSFLNNWEEISCALNKLDCAAGSAVIVTTKVYKDAHQYCSPASSTIPLRISLVAFYYEKAKEFVGEDMKSILGEILEKCQPSEFCMKMFVSAVYAHPHRSKEELQKLSDDLSYAGSSDGGAKANRMIKFFYDELHRDYKACLLYLSIFPPGGDNKISRSRLVTRWVVEGLIASEDWNKSVRRAKHCFYQLVNRWLVCPGDIGAGGKVKSCTLHEQVHDFITKMAKEEQIRDTRLSHGLARHFSIHSNIRLRTSEKIGDFLRNPSRASSQLQLLKVLDLEGCGSLEKNQNDLKNVCNMVILLKFLSLRKTKISKLPKEINKLQQLEVLDIRETCLCRKAIEHLMLTKLRHLLAGQTTDQSSSAPCSDHSSAPSSDQSSTPISARSSLPEVLHSTVLMPDKIGKMTGLQVLSHVEAPERCELQEIGELWQLRKLGVVIYGDQLKSLLRGISDLHECLESLSIMIKGPGPAVCPAEIKFNSPKFLKSLKISGDTEGRPFQIPKGLLGLLTKDNKELLKVTLQNTSLSKDDMEFLEDYDKLFSLRLQHVDVSELKFKSNTFSTLMHLLVEGRNIAKIIFEAETISNLDKFVVSSSGFDTIESLCDTGVFARLRHVEFNGRIIPQPSYKQKENSSEET